MEEEDLPWRGWPSGPGIGGTFSAQWQEKLPVVKGARGLGLMLALELDCPASRWFDTTLQTRAALNAVTPTALRLLPPLNISGGEDLERRVGNSLRSPGRKGRLN